MVGVVILLPLLMINGINGINYMVAGENLLNNNQPEDALQAFDAAIQTEDLNDFALSMVYWDMYLANRKLNNHNGMGNALSAFIIKANDSLNILKSDPDHPGHQMKLDLKIHASRMLLNILWMKHNKQACRSLSRACPITDIAFVQLLATEFNLCLNNEILNIKNVGYPISVWEVECKDSSKEYYYFELQ